MTNSTKQIPITTVHQHRIGLFPPVKQLQATTKGKDLIIENSHGYCKLEECKVTQIHAGIIEAMLASHVDIRKIKPLDKDAEEDECGQICVLISLPSVLRALGLSPRNTKWLMEHIKTLKSQSFDAEISGYKMSGYVISDINESKNVIETPGFINDGKLYWIHFGVGFSRFFLRDIGVDWRDLLPTITRMSGPSQAVARYCLSHREVNGEKIVDILSSLGQKWSGENAAKMMQKAVRQVTDDVDLFGDIGVQIELCKKVEDRKVRYKKDSFDAKERATKRKISVRAYEAGVLFG